MANNLTANYEAIIEISDRQINGLLAALHEHGANDDTRLKLLHSATMRVGDGRRRPDHGVDFGDWVRDFQLARGPIDVDDLRGELTGFAPPGIARMIGEAFGTLTEVVDPDPAGLIRGTVRLQLGSPSISVPAGSTSEVTVHTHVRAYYRPDPATDALPEPIHGDVNATFEVRQLPSAGGTKLYIRPSSDDSKIQFIAAAGSGLNAADVSRVAAQVRKALRDSFVLMPVDLPPDFAFSAFRGVSSGADHAIALPIQISGGAAPVAGIQNVTKCFVGPAGFAVAVGKEFITGIFQPTMDRLRQITQTFPVSIPVLPDPTYHFVVTAVKLLFNDGSIDLRIEGKATTGTIYAPNYNNIVITQRFTLVLFLGLLFISAPDDELTLSGLPGSAKSSVRNTVIAQRNQALPPAQDALNTQLRAAMTRLTTALQSFDPSASASLRSGASGDPGSSTSGAVAITPDGVILRGDIGGGSRSAPVVTVAETDAHDAFTAFASWVPGGRIDRFRWSWVEYSGPSIWSGIEQAATEEHRFIFPKPAGLTSLSGICLAIEGTQVLADGRVVAVSGGTHCHVPDFGELLQAPSWWEPVAVPIWIPNSTPESVLSELVAGHVAVQSDVPLGDRVTHNSLVYFVDDRSAEPLVPLWRAIERMRKSDLSLVAIVVLPDGLFESRRGEVERRLGLERQRTSVPVLVTQDDQHGWTRSFGVSRMPSMYLLDARRRFAWTHEGEVDPSVLAAALDTHLRPAPAPRSRPLRLAMGIGDPVPDIVLDGDEGQPFALHRLRGRRVLLNFWQAWSRPCIRELLRLQHSHEQKRGAGPFVVALQGRHAPRTCEAIRQQHGLTFPLLQDVNQRVARTYGIRCWPTTISISPDGVLEHVQFGVGHDRT